MGTFAIGASRHVVWTTPESIKTLARGKYPQGIEVQVLDHGYTQQYEQAAGKKADWFTTDGDLFPMNGTKFHPFEPRSPDGSRSFPRKNLSKGINEWNHYYLRGINESFACG